MKQRNQKIKQTPIEESIPLSTHLIKGRSHVNTEVAAELLGFSEGTLRKWHCLGTGPLKPVRVAGRLRWSVADITDLLNDGEK